MLVALLTAALAATPIRHADGSLAWNGLPEGNVYYASGALAWNGTAGSPVLHENGRVAWLGFAGSPLWDADGRLVWDGASRAGVRARLDDDVDLVVDRDDAHLVVGGRVIALGCAGAR